MKIPRFYNIHDILEPGKALIIYGPRQVGKTTLLMDFLKGCGEKYRYESGDNLKVQSIFGSRDLDLLKEYTSGYDIVAVDESHKIPHIGESLKIIVDHIPGLKVIVTGSSSFELAGQVGEPLIGRKKTLTLFPVAQLELRKIFNKVEVRDRIGETLVFGGYPEVITSDSKKEKAEILDDLVHSYLLKDILEFERIKGAKTLLDILRLLAFQIGKEVSLNEIAVQIGIDNKTVAKYIDLFEKSFIIFNLRGYSRNLRKEVTKKGKYYFYDTGIRNAVISNFNDLELRDDKGGLWENFLFIERLKKRVYHEIFANMYFWRTYNQKEIDLLEEREGRLFGYEFKWGEKTPKIPEEFLSAYPEGSVDVIDQQNYLDFVA
ncbi:MAG: ATP-binding protein [Candidatus Omnitrophota bacterium]